MISTTTTLSSSPNPATYGGTVTITEATSKSQIQTNYDSSGKMTSQSAVASPIDLCLGCC